MNIVLNENVQGELPKGRLSLDVWTNLVKELIDSEEEGFFTTTIQRFG